MYKLKKIFIARGLVCNSCKSLDYNALFGVIDRGGGGDSDGEVLVLLSKLLQHSKSSKFFVTKMSLRVCFLVVATYVFVWSF